MVTVGTFMVMEYDPTKLHNENYESVRVDGYYSEKDGPHGADGIADMWAQETARPGNRVVVVKIVYDAEQSTHSEKA